MGQSEISGDDQTAIRERFAEEALRSFREAILASSGASCP
jgi:hypothetical protein